MVEPPDESPTGRHGNGSDDRPPGIQRLPRHGPVTEAEGEHAAQWAGHFPLPPVFQAGDQLTQRPRMTAEPDHTREDPLLAAAGYAPHFIVPPVAPRSAPWAPLENAVGQNRLLVDRRP